VGLDEDPLGDVLALYDLIIAEYLSRTDADVIVATGLSQKPYDRVKFYYRLNDHASFLHGLGIVFRRVVPRMTRDFLVEFENARDALTAYSVLASVRIDGEDTPLFGEIDNRGDSLFVTLTYPKEITGSTHYRVDNRTSCLLPEVSFVAIKNGMHQEEGFAFFTPGVSSNAPCDGSHVASLGESILNYFGVSCSCAGDQPR
jgi:hypothetical protein